MNAKFAVAAAIFVSSASVLHCQDPKSGAKNMKYSRDAYSKVHMVAIAKLEFEAPPATEFKYDRYPNGGPERVQSGEGVDFARKDGKTWLKSEDWGETGVNSFLTRKRLYGGRVFRTPRTSFRTQNNSSLRGHGRFRCGKRVCISLRSRLRRRPGR
jgi:hypothetical protein